MDLIIQDAKHAMDILRQRAEERRTALMIGRSHGIHAESIAFGLKLAL